MIRDKCCWYFLRTCDSTNKCDGKGNVLHRGSLEKNRTTSKCLSKLSVSEASQILGRDILEINYESYDSR